MKSRIRNLSRCMGALSVLTVAAQSLAGCALTAKGDALAIRWFSPESSKTRITSAADGTRSSRDLALELGRVSSGLHLRDKIAYRDSAFEVGYYDDKRWTERPEVYVRRQISRTLFEERGFQRALQPGSAPVVDIEVLAFEEIRGKPSAARVQLRVLVHDDYRALVEKTITVDRPVTARGGVGALVLAMSQALDTAAEQVADAASAAAR